MADQEHLKLIKQGVQRWNEWRQQTPNVRPDLTNADLSRIRFSDADLSGANIRLTRHITDFSQWKHHDHYQKSLNRLLRDLKADTRKESQ